VRVIIATMANPPGGLARAVALCACRGVAAVPAPDNDGRGSRPARGSSGPESRYRSRRTNGITRSVAFRYPRYGG
jgi:hypothetical protein